MARKTPADWLSADSEIECAHCGERFYHELTRCPNCGRSVYEPEEGEGDGEIWGVDPDRDSLEEWVARLAPATAVFSGLFVSFLIGTGLFLTIRYLLGDLALFGPGRGLLLASVPMGAAVGGYVAAALDGEHPRRMGWAVGALSIIAAVVLAGVDRDLSSGGWIAADTIPLWLAAVLFGAAGSELWRRQQRDEVLKQLFPDLPSEQSLFDDLLAKVGHDTARVERLVELERQYMPNATRRTRLESAIERWERDNR